jgi:cyclic pyranopterin phosphate synthase
MPLDADHAWQRETMVTAAEIRTSLSVRYRLVPDDEPRDGAPAELFRVYSGADLVGRVGIIASVTESFCADCRRTRLTAEGAVRSCLFSHEEFDLLGPLRNGATDDELADLWRAAMWAKPSGHGLDAGSFDTTSFVQPERTMSAIGG